MVYSPLDALRHRAREPGPGRRLLRDRVRDDGAVDRADADAREGRGRAELLRASATTSRSCRRCGRCSSRPTCASTASSARVTSRPSSAHGRSSSSRPTTASRSSSRASSRSTCSSRSTWCCASSAEGRCEVENQYTRVVPYDGNPRRSRVLAEVFELRPHFEWRGLGFISHSGAAAVRGVRATSTPSSATRCPASASPTRRRVSAARC